LKTEDEAWKLDNRNNMKKETRNKKRSLHERTDNHGHGMAWCFGRFFWFSEKGKGLEERLLSASMSIAIIALAIDASHDANSRSNSNVQRFHAHEWRNAEWKVANPTELVVILQRNQKCSKKSLVF
jgi:hypothetical protein